MFSSHLRLVLLISLYPDSLPVIIYNSGGPAHLSFLDLLH